MFFYKQHVFLKTLSVIVLLFLALFCDYSHFLYLCCFFILWLLPCFRVFGEWGKLFLKTLPLFITYLGIGLVFYYPLDGMFIFCQKIIFMLLLSVYLTKTTKISYLMPQINLQNKYMYFIAYYLGTVFASLSILQKSYASQKDGRWYERALRAYTVTLSNLESLGLYIEKQLALKSNKRTFYLLPNLYFLILYAGFYVIMRYL